MAGTDFSYGLADVRDAEFDALVHKVRAEMEAPVDGGTVLKGTVLRLDSVPLEFLRDIPLVDGDWIDAEARLQLQGPGRQQSLRLGPHWQSRMVAS